MRIAVNDPVAQERPPPRVEQADRDRVARRLRRRFEFGEFLALEPLQRQKAARRQFGMDARHAHERPVGQHQAVEARDLRLANIVELLAHPLADFARDLARLDRRAHAPVQREQKVELRQVRFDRRRHLRILQLAGERLRRRASGPYAPGRARRPPRASSRIPRSGRASFGPSSATIRRRTKPAPIGGACDCRRMSSLA